MGRTRNLVHLFARRRRGWRSRIRAFRRRNDEAAHEPVVGQLDEVMHCDESEVD